MKKALLLFLLIVFLSPVAAFAQHIHSLAIQYSNPGINNNIRIIAEVILPSASPMRVGYTSAIINDTLYLTSCYHSGPLTVISQLKDTMQVGTVPSGIRGLHFRAYWSGNQSVCDSTAFDKKTVAFVITAPLGIKDPEQEAEPIIYPNPATNTIRIEGKQIQRVIITDLSGKKIRKLQSDDPSTFETDISELSKGIYLIEITGKDGSLYRKKIIKT